MGTETDERGHPSLSKGVRDRYGERFHVVEYGDHIELVPTDDDPLQGPRDAVGDAFDGKVACETSAGVAYDDAVKSVW